MPTSHPVVYFTDGHNIPIGKIICLARTYRKHAIEMGGMVKENPLLFLKPSSAVIYNQENIVLPKQSSDVHHEVELGIIIEKQGKNLSPGQAANYIAGYCLGLDITARDLQQIAKKHGWPWTIAKGFDTFCPLSVAVPPRAVPDPNNLSVRLAVNGKIRQCSSTSALIMTVEEIVAYVSSLMRLERGDIILTGTPEGVGQLIPGDIVEAQMGNLLSLTVSVVKEQ